MNKVNNIIQIDKCVQNNLSEVVKILTLYNKYKILNETNQGNFLSTLEELEDMH